MSQVSMVIDKTLSTDQCTYLWPSRCCMQRTTASETRRLQKQQ